MQYLGEPSVGQTLTAVLGLVQLGIGADQVDGAVQALPAALPAFLVDDAGADRPGSLGQAALTIAAVGEDPAGFGGVDYPARTLATIRSAAGPTATATATATGSPRPTATATASPTTAPPTTAPTTTAPTTTAPTTAPATPESTASAPGPDPPTGPEPSAAPTPPGGELPRTGSDLTLPLAGGGLAALAAGAAFVLLGRRRTR